MTANSDPGAILYASISCGSTILAQHVPANIDDLSALAAICVNAAPQFHLLYTHATGARLYAFLIASPLIFFAIADDSLGRPSILLFLGRLRDAALYVACQRIAADEPISHCCLQEELVPLIRRLAAGSVEEKPSSSCSDAGERRKKDAGREEGVEVLRGGDEREVTVGGDDDDGEADLRLGLGGRMLVERIWWQQVRVVLIIDVVVCSVLFGIWLSVCKGFQCIGG